MTVVLKLASSPRAAANSLSVFNVPGAESDKSEIAPVTKAVLAGDVSLSPEDAVATVTWSNTPAVVTNSPNLLAFENAMLFLYYVFGYLSLTAFILLAISSGKTPA